MNAQKTLLFTEIRDSYGTCETCGKSAPRITKGPFAGSSGMFDYCGYCSKNLCDDCMKNGYCRENKETHKHEPSGDNDE